MVSQPAAIVHRRVPLLLGRNDFLVPDVLANHQQQVFCLVLVDQVQVCPCPIHVEFLDAGIKVDQAHCHTADRYDGQVQPVTLVLDKTPFFHIGFQRVKEEVDHIKADLLGLL